MRVGSILSGYELSMITIIINEALKALVLYKNLQSMKTIEERKKKKKPQTRAHAKILFPQSNHFQDEVFDFLSWLSLVSSA